VWVCVWERERERERERTTPRDGSLGRALLSPQGFTSFLTGCSGLLATLVIDQVLKVRDQCEIQTNNTVFWKLGRGNCLLLQQSRFSLEFQSHEAPGSPPVPTQQVIYLLCGNTLCVCVGVCGCVCVLCVGTTCAHTTGKLPVVWAQVVPRTPHAHTHTQSSNKSLFFLACLLG